MLPKRATPNIAQLQVGIKNAVKRVENSKKYQPSIVLPQYSELRQKIILIENLVKQGRLTTKPNYHVIRDKDTLYREVQKIKQVKMLPWDSEFDNLNYEKAKLVGLSFTNKEEDQHYYVPFIHCDTQRNILPNQLTYEEFADVAGELFTNPDIKKITHQYNACDNQVLEYNTGLRVSGQYWDTLLFMNAIDENHKDNSLKKLYVEFVLGESGKDESFESLFEGISFAFVPIDVGYIYSCYDSERTDAVYEWQKKYLSAPEYKKML
jgi:DNA polymerase I-like protein with 3'-5' exonuclease and polymerase domains